MRLSHKNIVSLLDEYTFNSSFTLSPFNIKKEPNNNTKNSYNHKCERPCQITDGCIHYFISYHYFS